jgi:hypothetical protein
MERYVVRSADAKAEPAPREASTVAPDAKKQKVEMDVKPAGSCEGGATPASESQLEGDAAFATRYFKVAVKAGARTYTCNAKPGACCAHYSFPAKTVRIRSSTNQQVAL